MQSVFKCAHHRSQMMGDATHGVAAYFPFNPTYDDDDDDDGARNGGKEELNLGNVKTLYIFLFTVSHDSHIFVAPHLSLYAIFVKNLNSEITRKKYIKDVTTARQTSFAGALVPDEGNIIAESSSSDAGSNA